MLAGTITVLQDTLRLRRGKKRPVLRRLDASCLAKTGRVPTPHRLFTAVTERSLHISHPHTAGDAAPTSCFTYPMDERGSSGYAPTPLGVRGGYFSEEKICVAFVLSAGQVSCWRPSRAAAHTVQRQQQQAAAAGSSRRRCCELPRT